MEPVLMPRVTMSGTSVGKFQAGFARARPWCALATLVLLYAAPDCVRDGGFHPLALRISGDLLALLTLTAVSYKIEWGNRVRPLLGAFAFVLCVVCIDRSIARQLMYEEPLLYDQLFMAQHLFVLVSDLWSPMMGFSLAVALLVIAAIVWGCVRLLKSARELLSPERAPGTLRVTYGVWLLALCGSVTDVVGLSRKPIVQWSSPALAANVDESIETYHAVRSNLGQSPYAAYEKIKLSSRPDIHFYVVESYGRLLWDQKDMHRFHDRVLKELEQRLAEAGVYSVSGFSTSNVKGARSWLADGTLMMGTIVRYEAVFHHALRHVKKQQTLVSFLNNQGYDTLLVAPADRARLGLTVVNRYGYDRVMAFEDLKYRGDRYGWGMIPDQHTIGFVNERVVAPAKAPQFINFHLVTSHAPWREIPARVPDWHTLSSGSAKNLELVQAGDRAVAALAQRYDRVDTGLNFRPAVRKFIRAYMRTIAYDLDLIVDEVIRKTDRGRLTIALGDHQPPLITSIASSYDSPIHVFSRDPRLLEELKAQGFKDGLRLGGKPKPVIGHGGLFSLLVRTLLRAGDPHAALPPLVRKGRELMPKAK